MNIVDYRAAVDGLLKLAEDIQERKMPAYTIGSRDVLANFKRSAERCGITPLQAWLVFFMKHVDAISAFVCDPGIIQAEALDGRFADAVNYLKLGHALILDNSQNEEGNPQMAQMNADTGNLTRRRGGAEVLAHGQ